MGFRGRPVLSGSRRKSDDEISGTGNAVSYKYRVHDARVGRFLSIDPLAAKYPWNSAYAFSENRVIDGVELEGLENILLVDKYETTLLDLMKIYSTNDGKTKISHLNDFDFRKYVEYGPVKILSVILARNSTYIPSSNTLKYGNGLSWYLVLAEKASFPSYVILGHELNHAYDEFKQQNGIYLNMTARDLDIHKKYSAEAASVDFANYLRSVYGYEGDWLRDEYQGSFNDRTTAHINLGGEKVTNLELLEGWEFNRIYTPGKDRSEFDQKYIDPGKFYSISYEKSYKGGERRKHFVVSWMDESGFLNIKDFDKKGDYNEFLKKN